MDEASGRHRGRSRWPRPNVAVLTVVVVGWWLLLGGAVVWIMPERDATAAPTPPAVVSPGLTVRISQPDGPPFPVAGDRAGFDAVRVAAAAKDEGAVTRAFASFAWIDVADGQAARVLAVDGEAVQIELLDGPHLGDSAWIRRHALVPAQ